MYTSNWNSPRSPSPPHSRSGLADNTFLSVRGDSVVLGAIVALTPELVLGSVVTVEGSSETDKTDQVSQTGLSVV